jgi:hypothetical protein
MHKVSNFFPWSVGHKLFKNSRSFIKSESREELSIPGYFLDLFLDTIFSFLDDFMDDHSIVVEDVPFLDDAVRGEVGILLMVIDGFIDLWRPEVSSDEGRW